VFVSLLCMTLFDMVLCCLAYQVLSCVDFVVSIIETKARRKECVVDALSEGEGFVKSRNRSKISHCISHTFCWPCCSFVK
jgi:hypothetical protein